MVRIIIHKAGVAVDEMVLEALINKLLNADFIVAGSTLERDRAVIVVNTAMPAANIMQRLRSAKKHVVCEGCQTIHLRGELPDDIFRCVCGAYLNKPLKNKIQL